MQVKVSMSLAAEFFCPFPALSRASVALKPHHFTSMNQSRHATASGCNGCSIGHSSLQDVCDDISRKAQPKFQGCVEVLGQPWRDGGRINFTERAGDALQIPCADGYRNVVESRNGKFLFSKAGSNRCRCGAAGECPNSDLALVIRYQRQRTAVHECKTLPNFGKSVLSTPREATGRFGADNDALHRLADRMGHRATGTEPSRVSSAIRRNN